jgi:hypothetical protein
MDRASDDAVLISDESASDSPAKIPAGGRRSAHPPRTTDDSASDSPVKISAAERRAANLQRANEQMEARKQALIDARNKKDKEKNAELPNVLTEEQVCMRVYMHIHTYIVKLFANIYGMSNMLSRRNGYV